MPNRYSPDEWLGTMPYPPPEMPPELQTVPVGQAPQGYVSQIDPFGLANAYEGAPSYIPMGNVPQPQMPPEVQAMIGGQGFDPATMAAMRAGTIEDISNAALPQLAGTRRALGQAGLTNSPAGQAYIANIGRQTGDKQASGLQQLNVSNAMLGNENKKFGLNLAHQWAMENANRLFEAMGQNLQQSGANLRTGAQIAFGENPFQPSAGQPKQSAAGAALGGAAEFMSPNHGGFGQPQDTANQAPGTPPFLPPTEAQADRAFSKNPFKGY